MLTRMGVKEVVMNASSEVYSDLLEKKKELSNESANHSTRVPNLPTRCGPLSLSTLPIPRKQDKAEMSTIGSENQLPVRLNSRCERLVCTVAILSIPTLRSPLGLWRP